MSRYLLSHAADANLNEIADGPSNAVAILESLHSTFQVLADHPGVGALREDLLPGIRVFSPPRPANNYVVFFYPMLNGVEVAAVIHGSQDWIKTFTRGELRSTETRTASISFYQCLRSPTHCIASNVTRFLDEISLDSSQANRPNRRRKEGA